ncbi:hypothetical protein BDY24DRAFT_403161 [Mrakia frigida]|uniref:uncharacterized protein n=1 Tax=Mrakia frigida TaxID=29902 RepID=UPI003FCBEF63
MQLSFLSLLALSLVPSCLARRTLNWQKYGSQILQHLQRADGPTTSAFVFNAQNADKTLVPLFKKFKHVNTSIFAPTNAAFLSYITESGGNMSDPKQQSTKEFKQKWNDQFTYFFINGTFLTTDLVVGETVLVDTYKKSPAGDWPLQFAIDFTSRKTSLGFFTSPWKWRD